MRVEVVESLANRVDDGEPFSDGAVERALKNFLAAVESDDSLFRAENGALRRTEKGNDQVCRGMLGLKFRDERLMRSRAAHFSLLEKLRELLKQAGSADSLGVLMALRADGQGTQQEFALGLVLEARGNSAEQAGLRWGLGLVHVQQALLFASRLLRQQLTSRGD